MSFKKTLLMGVILIIATLILTRGVIPHEELAKKRDLLLGQSTATEVARIAVQREGKEYVLVNANPKKKAESAADEDPEFRVVTLTDDEVKAWSIEGVANSPLDKGAITGLLNDALELKLSEKIPAEERATDLAEYGLAAPKLSATFKAADKSVTLQFGDKSEYHSGKQFAKVKDEADIYLISGGLGTLLDKPSSEFRNKGPIQFNDSDIASVVLKSGSEEQQLKREAGKPWRFVAPGEFTASSDGVSNLLREVKNLRASEFIDDGEGRLAEFALDAPALQGKIEFTSDSKKQPLEFQVGTKKAAEGSEVQAYFRVLGQPTVYKIADRNPVPVLFKPVNELREKKLFSFDVTRVKKAEFSHGSTALVVEKQGESWKVNQKDGDEAFIREALRKLSELEASGFPKSAPKEAFTAPSFKAVLTLTSAAPAKEGETPKDEQRTLVVGAAGEPTADKKSTVLVGVDELKEPFLILSEVASKLVPTEEQLAKLPTPIPTPVVATAVAATAAPTAVP